jgi:ferritin-like metal-binding protein YciE
MGWFSADMQTMKDLFIHSMHDIFYAEHQIEKALPNMVTKASDAACSWPIVTSVPRQTRRRP